MICPIYTSNLDLYTVIMIHDMSFINLAMRYESRAMCNLLFVMHYVKCASHSVRRMYTKNSILAFFYILSI